MLDLHIFRTFLRVIIWGTNGAPHNLYLEPFLAWFPPLIKYFAGPD